MMKTGSSFPSGFPDKLFKHPKLTMTILHCGLNGVQESLYTTVFLLCVYHMVIDYFEVAGRLEHAKVGIPLYSAIVTKGG